MPFSEKGGSIFWGRLRKVFFYFSVEPGKKGAPFFKKVPFSGGPGGGRGGGPKMGGPGKSPGKNKIRRMGGWPSPGANWAPGGSRAIFEKVPDVLPAGPTFQFKGVTLS